MLVCVAQFERQAFQDTSKLAGMPLSAWVRKRLRQVAFRDLEAPVFQSLFSNA